MKLLRIVFLLFITNNCHISTSQISGVVKDIKGNPVEYASIKFKNSYEGTVTDSLGVSLRPRTYCQLGDLSVSLMAKNEDDIINI